MPASAIPQAHPAQIAVLTQIVSAGHEGGLAGLRDRALILTLYYQGLRRSEAAKLNHQDLRRDAGILVLRDTKTTDRDEVSRHVPLGSAWRNRFPSVSPSTAPTRPSVSEPAPSHTPGASFTPV